MDKSELLYELGKTLSKTKATRLAELASQEAIKLIDLWNLCYHTQRTIAFRAAWILGLMESRNPRMFSAMLALFIRRLDEQHHTGCQREFSKILIQYTKPSALKMRKEVFDVLPIDLKERMVEVLFEWLIKTGTPVAVQVNCMDVLFYMIPAFPWIAEELESQIVFYLQDGSAAMQSRGRKLLAKMHKH